MFRKCIALFENSLIEEMPDLQIEMIKDNLENILDI